MMFLGDPEDNTAEFFLGFGKKKAKPAYSLRSEGRQADILRTNFKRDRNIRTNNPLKASNLLKSKSKRKGIGSAKAIASGIKKGSISKLAVGLTNVTARKKFGV